MAEPTPNSRRKRWLRFFRRRLQFWGGFYVLLVLGMWLFENGLVFQTTPASQVWYERPSAAIEDVHVTTTDGTALHGWWLPPGPDRPVVLWCSGNAGNVSCRGQMMSTMAGQLDVGVLVVDYPGYGRSAGRPNEARCYDAAEATIRWIRDEKHVPPGRMVFYGESLGGGVATEIATRHPCRALVLVKTYTSLPAAAKSHFPLIPCHWLMSNRFENIDKIATVGCPVFVVGATNDRVVPYAHSEALYAAASEPKGFFPCDGHDHNSNLPPELWPALAEFLRRLP